MIAGTFDNFHVGHQYLIAQAIKEVEGNRNKERGELVVVVARDETVKKIKRHTNKHSEVKRLETVKNYLENFSTSSLLHFHVRLGRADADFLQTLREEFPDILLLGYDQQFDSSKLGDEFARVKVKRAEPYKPEIFKSSRF